MIKFQKNGNTVKVVEGKEEFKQKVMDSQEVATILADGNFSQLLEMYVRFNNGSEFVFKIDEDRFNKLNFGYGLDEAGKNIKIVVFFNEKNELVFASHINGYMGRVYVQDGDVISETPLYQPSQKDFDGVTKLAKDLEQDGDSKSYRSRLFTLANQLRGELGISQKEAFSKAKELLNTDKETAFTKNNEPVKQDEPVESNEGDMDALINALTDILADSWMKLFYSSPERSEYSANKKHEVSAESEENLLVEQLKKLAKHLEGINSVQGEINKIFGKQEKSINPDSQTNSLISRIEQLLNGKK